MKIVVSVDIGSSSVRCLAYNVDADHVNNVSVNHVICSSSIQCCSVQPNTGRIAVTSKHRDDFTKKGETISILDMVDSCVDNVLKQLNQRESLGGVPNYYIIALGISTFVMNFVAIDHDGYLLGDDYTMSYACNTADVAREVLKIRNEIGKERVGYIYQQTGAPIHSAYAIGQLRSLYKSADCDRIQKWQTIASACVARWTSRQFLPISYSEASWTGLLNFRTCEYEPSAIQLLPDSCKMHLPDLADYNDLDLTLDPLGAYSIRWPELRNTKFFLGLGDGACANIGSKCTTTNRIACTVGTSAAARICLPLPIQPHFPFYVEPGLFCYRIDKLCVIVGGALTDGGSVVEWITKLCRFSDAEFEECLALVSALRDEEIVRAAKNNESNDVEASSLTMLPFLSGERSTGFRIGASGTIHGITRETTAAHILKAGLEGVSLRIKAIVKLIKAVVDHQKREQKICENENDIQIVCSGKALENNTVWRQMLADSTGLSVILDVDTNEGTSRGIARMVLLASASVSLHYPQLSPWRLEEKLCCHTAGLTLPHNASISIWNKMLDSQENLINTISPLYQENCPES